MALIFCTGNAFGQIYEDRMAPVELGIRDIDSLLAPMTRYVGNDTCLACHPDTYRRWLGSKHARASVALQSQMAVEIGKAAGITAAEPALSGTCLACHATAHNVPADFREPGFRMGEGVTCEKCHGPGKAHLAAMDSRFQRSWLVAKLLLVRAARNMLQETGWAAERRQAMETACLVCHKVKDSHKMSESQRFSFLSAWREIAH